MIELTYSKNKIATNMTAPRARRNIVGPKYMYTWFISLFYWFSYIGLYVLPLNFASLRPPLAALGINLEVFFFQKIWSYSCLKIFYELLLKLLTFLFYFISYNYANTSFALLMRCIKLNKFDSQGYLRKLISASRWIKEIKSV